ncbi:MAG TPA: DUF6456 domain-containing protein [Rhizomicrobium sp.]|nr:DUF6456 domain-containing protein [Rhizomicrobium sp.]
MTRLAERQILQEARRVLRRLAAPRQALLARGAGFVVARGPGAASRITVAADMVQAFLARGWIAPDGPGRHVIAPAGRDLVAREGPDGFAGQHRLMERASVRVEGEEHSVRINAAESPLARLRHRGLVGDTQFAAGEKLRRDFTLGQLGARMGVDWSRPVVSGGPGTEHISDIALAARQRLGRALGAVGPGLSDLLLDVCCHLTTLEQVEMARGWARRSARVVLGIALDRLAAHYGLDVVRRTGDMRAWSLDEAS